MDAEIIRCASCGQANRVPSLERGKAAICGRCKAPLTPSGGRPVELTDGSFAGAIRDGRATVVDFWAAWCGPCRTISPLIEELATERSEVRFAKVNVDDNPQTAGAFNVQGIPLLVFFKDGVEKGRVVGAVPKGQIESAIARYLA
jgi:thioredoxin